MKTLVAAAALTLALAPAAVAAPSRLTVKVAPARPGPIALSLDLAVGTNSTGEPPAAASSVATRLPPGVVADLASLRGCRRGRVESDHTSRPPRCPRRSRLGSGAVAAYIPAFKTSMASDRVAIVYVGHGRVVLWWHEPVYGITGTVDGTISRSAVSWDLAPYSSGRFTGDNEVRLTRLETSFRRRLFAAHGCRTRAWSFGEKIAYASGGPQAFAAAVPCGRRARRGSGMGTAPSAPSCSLPICPPTAARRRPPPPA